MSKKSGFTIMEILAALFLFALFLTPVLVLLQSSARGITVNKDDITLHCASSELAEQLLSIPYDEVPTGFFGNAQIVDNQPIASDSTWLFHCSPLEKGTRQIQIDEIAVNGRPRYKKMTISLSLPPAPGNTAARQFNRTVLYAREQL